MASKTDIVNRALSKLGQSRVSSIDTNTEAARVMNDMWDNVRDALLQSYPWNFSIKRVLLAKDSTAPAWGYVNRFTLPSDFLALMDIRNDPEYTIENGYILSDEGAPLYVRYVSKVEDTGLYPPLFTEALAASLAYEACEKITQSNTKKEILFSDLNFAINRAYVSDAIDNPSLVLPEDTWLTDRL